MAPDFQFQFVRAGKLHFFCPLCHYHQSTNTIERMKLRHHLQLALLTCSLVILAWPIFGLKAAAFYFFFWGAFEMFYRLRKRQALVCESCGFDPFLYKQDVNRARKALRKHWEEKIDRENLFEGIKLKNYTTKGIKKAALAAESSSTDTGGASEKNSAPPL